MFNIGREDGGVGNTWITVQVALQGDGGAETCRGVVWSTNVDRNALGDFLCCAGDGPGDGVAKAVACIGGTGCIGEVNHDQPVFLAPCVHGHTVGFGLGSTRGGEHEFTGIEVLGDIDVVGSTLSWLDLF